MKSTPQRSKTSRITSKLQFPEPAINAEYLTREFMTPIGKSYELEARILKNKHHDKPWVISIHGAHADYSKANAVSFGLQERNISVLGITMSGHSKASPLEAEETSLANNIHEAESFFADLDPIKPVVVMGFSLGGTPALKLLEKHADKISKIVLFYPGIYSKNSYDKSYGEPFRSVLSKPYSYRDNDTIELLQRFPGKLMLVKGEYDGLDPVAYGKPAGTSAGEIEIAGKKYSSPIPKEVIESVKDAVPAERRTYIEIPGCDHSVILWMREHPEQSKDLLDTLTDFILS